MLVENGKTAHIPDAALRDRITKILLWVHENPGCHPANIRAELIALGKEMGLFA